MREELRWDFDYLWHFLEGVGFNGLVFWLLEAFSVHWLPLLLGVALLALFGVAREGFQHDWSPLTPHRMIEAWTWPLGGCVPLIAGIFQL